MVETKSERRSVPVGRTASGGRNVGAGALPRDTPIVDLQRIWCCTILWQLRVGFNVIFDVVVKTQTLVTVKVPWPSFEDIL